MRIFPAAFKPVVLTGTCIAALLAGPAHAQKLTPGLWEYSMAMKGAPGAQVDAAMAHMKDELARMTPEQRKAMQDMMASQGVSMGGSPGAPISARVCITPEQAERDELPLQGPQERDGSCKQTSKERSGNMVRFKFACTDAGNTSGQGEYTFVSDKEHRGHTVIDSTVRGKPQRMEMDQTGRWLGADCGRVKPRPAK